MKGGKVCYIVTVALLSVIFIIFNVLVGIFGCIRANEADAVSETPLWIKFCLYLIPAVLAFCLPIALLVLGKKTSMKFATSIILFVVAVLLAIFTILSIVGVVLIEYDWTEEL